MPQIVTTVEPCISEDEAIPLVIEEELPQERIDRKVRALQAHLQRQPGLLIERLPNILAESPTWVDSLIKALKKKGYVRVEDYDPKIPGRLKPGKKIWWVGSVAAPGAIRFPQPKEAPVFATMQKPKRKSTKQAEPPKIPHHHINLVLESFVGSPQQSGWDLYNALKNKMSFDQILSTIKLLKAQRRLTVIGHGESKLWKLCPTVEKQGRLAS